MVTVGNNATPTPTPTPSYHPSFLFSTTFHSVFLPNSILSSLSSIPASNLPSSLIDHPPNLPPYKSIVSAPSSHRPNHFIHSTLYTDPFHPQTTPPNQFSHTPHPPRRADWDQRFPRVPCYRPANQRSACPPGRPQSEPPPG